MTSEIRPVRDTEIDEYRRAARTSLMISPEMASPDAVNAIRPEMTLCAFEDGKLATTYAWWPLKMRLNGTSCPVAGITFVGTLPVYRRRGNLRRIISRHFKMIREQGGQSIAALHASRASIYHRYGYGVVSTEHSYSFVPRDLHFVRPVDDTEPPGKLREMEGDEIDTLKELYREFCRDRTGYIHRGRATWDGGVLSPPSENGELFRVVHEENNRPTGYVIYTITPRKVAHGRPWHHVSIRDFVWLSPGACHGLWQLFSSMDLACEIDWKRVPPDDPLPHLFLEPRRLNIGSKDGLMARVVDVESALPQRYYNGEGDLCFDLIDDLCPWNSGKWRLETSGKSSILKKTEKTPEMILPVDTLAMLFFGQVSASEAARMGRLEARAPGALAKWDWLLQTRHKPFCADFF